jgi:prolyl oligopeptidase
MKTALVLATLTAATALSGGSVLEARPAYPPTTARAVVDTLHGTALVDPYRWLEDGASAEVEGWTEAQNAFTRSVLDAFPGRAALTAAYEKAFAVNTVVSATPFGSRVFVQRKEGLKNQPTIDVYEGGPSSARRTAIDPNGFSSDGTVALDWWYPSRDGALVAYGRSDAGSEMSTLYVRDVATGKDLADVIPRTQYATVAWDPDGKGFLYTRHPAKGEVPAGEEVFHKKVFHHRLGDDPAKDPLVYGGEPGAPIQEFRSVSMSSDYAWVFLTLSTDWAKNDLYARKAGSAPDAPWITVAKGLEGRTSPDAVDGKFLLLTDVGSPRYRIATADPAAATTWTDLVPEQAGVIEGFTVVGGKLALHVRENVVSRVRLFGLDGRFEKEIDLPTLGTVDGLGSLPQGSDLYFRFASFAYPSMAMRYDLKSGRLAPVETRDLPYDPRSYVTAQEWATSKDGTKIPMFVVRRAETVLDGNRPTLLYGYGGFNVSETPEYKATVFPWLDRGGVYVVSNLRGGGEFGSAWHEAGRLDHKQNVYDDLYACAEWLTAHNVTKSARLAVWGGSNGGLLVGAAITQRPELWGAAVCEVPLLDMIRYQNFSIARYWVPEYGSSEDPAQFRTLLAYSPYQNVKDGVKYPPTLFTAGAFDSRVDPLHARKMAALLQAKDQGDGPILLRVEGKAGHGQGKPTRKRIDAAVDVMSFVMDRLGVEVRPTPSNAPNRSPPASGRPYSACHRRRDG